MKKEYRQIGKALLDKGLISEEQLAEVLAEQRITKELFGQILLKKRWITEKDFLETLSEQFGFAYAALTKQDVDFDIALRFSTTLIVEHSCIPIKEDEHSVTVAISNPLDAWALSAAEKEAGLRRAKFILISEEDMRWLLQQYHRYKKANIQRLFDKD